MDFRKSLGLDYGDVNAVESKEDMFQYINFKLAALGLPSVEKHSSEKDEKVFLDLFEEVIEDYREKKRMLSDRLIPVNKRIQRFMDQYFDQTGEELKAISDLFILDRYGLARELSLPVNGDEFSNEYLKSYRIKQGVLNNPRNDRRTTKGSFHIVEGSMKVPFDKKEVPKVTFAKLYQEAINPPKDLMKLPFTACEDEVAETFVSLYVRPTVSPEVPGLVEEKTMEVQFVVPGSFVTNLDFVESVFGNGGDPSLHINDAGIDVKHWSGHTGYIVLAPHLTQLKKIDLGLPHYDDATKRQRKEGMCYQSEDELYNDGVPFKITCRDESGVVITLIADNYFGYSKKEIKTQLSYAANLFGMVEEEHAGGTIAFPQTNLGENFTGSRMIDPSEYSFEEVKKKYGDIMHLMPGNYAIDNRYDNVVYLPENVEIDLHKTEIKWEYKGKTRALKLLPTYYYVLPNGYKIHMEKHPSAPAWKLVGTEAEGTFCHKPCTVSGGGKSEISKALDNSIIYGTYFIYDLKTDLDQVEDIINRDYSNRWLSEEKRKNASRSILSSERTLGSVIKLLTPSAEYNEDYNEWLESIPNYIKALVFMVKRFYIEEWGENWRDHFSVDIVNGKPGNELNFNNRKIRPSYLRVGFDKEGAWRIFKLRMDFMPAEKLQMEDDISSSVVLSSDHLEYLNEAYDNPSVKFTKNCEYRFFQRPDEAVHKGYDKEAEADLAEENIFITNFEPLEKEEVQEIKEDVMEYIDYTDPMKNIITGFLEEDTYKYCVISSESRRLDNKTRSKNPRYLQVRSDFKQPIKEYLGDLGARLARKVPLESPVLTPVNAVLPGRRNNPPGLSDGKKILPLSVYNPIHYQELPELFMDFISSLSGKSPSTTGSGSEGALTKGPFNMLVPTYDLNNALLSYILTGYEGFSSPAGYIGPDGRVDHDISMLMPEIWCRLNDEEKDPKKLIANGALEKIDDFEYNGEKVPASRLGYRITDTFMYKYMGKIFDEPQTIFTEGILKPEAQDLEAFVDGVLNIASSHKRVAAAYFEDGSVEEAIPPLKALLHIMAYGEYKGHTIHDPEVRSLFDREVVINSDWYKKRLVNKQTIDIRVMEQKIENLNEFINDPINKTLIDEFNYNKKLEVAEKKLAYFKSNAYVEFLVGTLGADDIMLRKN